MSDSVIYKGSPPPPPTPKQRAQRRRQMRLVLSTLTVIIVGGTAWGVMTWINAADDRAEKQVQAGILLMSPGHYQEAIPFFDRALEISPNSWNAHLRRGEAHNNLGERDAAVADYRAALAIKGDVVEAISALATIYR